MVDVSKKSVIVIVVILIMVASTLGIYYWYSRDRTWTMEEVWKQTWDTGEFDESMRGKTITMVGEVTDIISTTTSQGELYLVELDHENNVQLVYWDDCPYDLGDEVEEQVKIEEIPFNGGYVLGSKQLTIQPMIYAQATRYVMDATNEISGLHFYTSVLGDGAVKIEVVMNDWLWDDEPVNISLDRSSARIHRGFDCLESEYQGTGQEDPVILDVISDLSSGDSENAKITFYDANDNGFLDTGDYFIVEGLELPAGDRSEIFTYHLTLHLEDAEGPTDLDHWTCYLIYGTDGPLFFDIP